MYQLKIDKKVIRDLQKIDKKYQTLILKKINTTLVENPYIGKQLTGVWGKYHRLRIADYRVIYQIFDREIVVEIITIKHRSKVYKK